MFNILMGSEEFIPKGIFDNHFSVNVGNNHETHIEYIDSRIVELPLRANCELLAPEMPADTKRIYHNCYSVGVFGGWQYVGIYERREALKRIRKR